MPGSPRRTRTPLVPTRASASSRSRAARSSSRPSSGSAGGGCGEIAMGRACQTGRPVSRGLSLGDGHDGLLVARLGARAAQPPLAVLAHALDDGEQRLALLGQGVLDARRDLAERLALDDALLLQRAQAQREGAG